jgi:hypothetical protein
MLYLCCCRTAIDEYSQQIDIRKNCYDVVTDDVVVPWVR